MTPNPPAVDGHGRSRVVVAATIFIALMVGALVVAVVFPEVGGGPTKDIPLGGEGATTDDNTGAAWLRAALGFGLVAAWVVVLGYQLRKARVNRSAGVRRAPSCAPRTPPG